MRAIIFLGLVQNIEPLIPRLLKFLASVEAAGISTGCIFGENGSKDRTREALLAISHGRMKVLDTSFMVHIPGRLRRMALGREALQKELDRIPWHFEFVCVVDWDVLLAEPINPVSFAHALDQLAARDDIFAVSATSHPTYYDLLAYEDTAISFADLPMQAKQAQRDPWTYYRFYSTQVYPAQARLTRSDELAATSAFNGMCIYKKDDFASGSYTTSGNFDICEHVNLHRSIAGISGKRIAVLPGLSLLAPREHIHKSLPVFAFFALRKLLTRLSQAPLRKTLARLRRA